MHHKILKVQMHQYLGFYSCDQNFKVVVENTFISCELDRLIEASPSSATVLGIITASGSRPLPNEAVHDVAIGGASEVTCCFAASQNVDKCTHILHFTLSI